MNRVALSLSLATKPLWWEFALWAFLLSLPVLLPAQVH